MNRFRLVRMKLAALLIAISVALPFARVAAEELNGKLNGTLRIEPRKVIRMDETPVFTITYTVGAAGLGRESHLWIGTPNQFSRPQTETPGDYGFCEVSSSNPALSPVLVTSRERGWGFGGWGWATEVRFGGSARAGDTVVIAYGKGKGVRLGDIAFAFTVRARILHAGDPAPRIVAETAPLWLSGSQPRFLTLTAPSTVAAGEAFDVTVVARDGADNRCAGYRGTVRLTLSGGGEPRTVSHRFTEEDAGRCVFRDLRLPSAGTWTIAGRDDVGIAGESNPVEAVSSPPRERIYWGELHMHTTYSDGLGTPATAFRYGRDVEALDFVAVTDHGMLMSDADWERTRQAVREADDPGHFVSILAYEWSGPVDAGGDHNVYFIDAESPLFRHTDEDASHVRKLFAILKRREAFLIPHVGGRTADPNFHDDAVQPAVEIHSSHGVFEPFAFAFLTRGYRMGVVAGSDGHDGNAGRSRWLRNTASLRGGLTAIRASSLDRRSVFEAIRRGRTYATTGERMLLDLEVNDRKPGFEVATRTPPRIKVMVTGTAPLRRVDVVRDAECIRTFLPAGRSFGTEFIDADVRGGEHFYTVRAVQNATPQQASLTLPKRRGLELDSRKWTARIRNSGGKGAAGETFELRSDTSSCAAWSSPVRVTKR